MGLDACMHACEAKPRPNAAFQRRSKSTSTLAALDCLRPGYGQPTNRWNSPCPPSTPLYNQSKTMRKTFSKATGSVPNVAFSRWLKSTLSLASLYSWLWPACNLSGTTATASSATPLSTLAHPYGINNHFKPMLLALPSPTMQSPMARSPAAGAGGYFSSLACRMSKA